MSRRLAARAVLVSGSAVLAALAAVQQDEDLPERLGQIAERAVAEERIAVLSVAVDVGGESLVARGFGREGSGARRTVDTSTRLPAGWLNEELVAVALLSLAESEKLTLDDALGKHVPELAETTAGISLASLLSHTSGLPALERAAAGRDLAAADAAAVVTWLAEAPREGEPGDCFLFSNANVFLAGLVVQRTVGTDLVRHLRQTILEPLEMSDTRYCAEPDEAETCHELAGGLASDASGLHLLGASCLCTSVADLVRFQRGIAGQRVLGKVGWELFRSPVRLADGSDTARGLGANATPLDDDVEGLSFGGSVPGARGHVAYYPALDATIVVLAGSEDARVERLERRLARALFEAPEPGLRDEPTTPGERARYVGTYQIGCLQLGIAERSGALVYESAEGRRERLIYQGADVFVAADDPELSFSFVLEDERAVSVLVDDHGKKIRALRIG